MSNTLPTVDSEGNPITPGTIPEVGAVISGTYKASELLKALADELTRVCGGHCHQKLIADAHIALDFHPDSPAMAQESEAVIERLFSALQDYAPDGMHFGAAEGGNNNFGWWQIDATMKALYPIQGE